MMFSLFTFALLAGVMASHLITVITATNTDSQSDNNGDIPVKNIGLMTATLPWTFGPYQAQMYQLSLILNQHSNSNDSSLGDPPMKYKIFWIPNTLQIPHGTYTVSQFRKYVPTIVPPPPDFKLDHLTFVGNTEPASRPTSSINELASRYQLDAIITLMDNNKIVPGDMLNVPLIGWVPLHMKDVKKTTPDYWCLRNFHGIAGLAPSTTQAIQDAVGEKMDFLSNDESEEEEAKSTSPGVKALQEMYGQVQVEFIPHIINRHEMNSSATKGLQLLETHSVAAADAILNKAQIVNRGQPHSLEPGHDKSLFRNSKRNNDFIILLQGGNYETADRKGWDTSLQAFAHFYHSFDTPPTDIHLLIHSTDGTIIASDRNLESDAPPEVMPLGLMIDLNLHNLGVPKDAYTLDITKHASPIVAAFKKRASVCLHPSKVEGFGMNVIECQAVGTPVITTNYTAMGDFTFIGKSVPYRQMISSPGVPYAMSMPDVLGVADSLQELYEEHKLLNEGNEQMSMKRQNQIENFNEWIDRTCSEENVGKKFHQLIQKSFQEFENRKKGKEKLLRLTSGLPTEGAYRIASGYHTTIVDWDAPWTLLAPDGLEIVNPDALHQHAWKMLESTPNSSSSPMMLLLPTTYDNGQPVPFMTSDGKPHEDLTILVRTFMVASVQQRMSRRTSIVWSAIGHSNQNHAMLPNGLAIIRKKSELEKDMMMMFGGANGL